MLKKVLVCTALVGFVGVGLPQQALADPPGPGDKQCIPGQNPPPKPGAKGGSCPGR